VSAGTSDATLRVSRDLTLLAPRFRDSVELAIRECNLGGLDAFVYEAHRSVELQALYYARGRTIIPPPAPITNARDKLFSWHGFGLAVDVISRAAAWSAGEAWFERVASVFRRHGCRWGGEWRMRDLPHFQWGPCKPSPSDLARQIYRTDGLRGVWLKVGAA
jgi:peptidoglycan L-alanyl-D-glutamate endopeptidase CwlK